MNSIEQLNNYSATPVNYNTASDYFIQFGTNQGNVTVSQGESTLFNLSKRIPLEIWINSSYDMLITLQFNNVTAVQDVIKQGNNTNIGIVKGSTTQWVVTGIRSIQDFNDAWTQIYVVSKPNILVPFQVTVTINDQRGTTRSWVETVNMIVNPIVTYPTTIFGSEDNIVSLENINIVDNHPVATDYTLFLTTDINTGNIVFNNVATANFSYTDSRTVINDFLDNKVIAFRPATDYVGTTNMGLRVQRTVDGTITPLANIAMAISEQDEYYVENPQYYRLNKPNTLITQVIDQDINANVYTITFNQSTGNAGTFYINGNAQVGNTVTISNSRANVNSTTVAWQPGNNYYGNATILYSQSKISSGNTIVQANNVPITTVAGIFNLNESRTYYTDYWKTVFDNIIINPVYEGGLAIKLGTDSNQGVFATNDTEAQNRLTANAGFSYYWTNNGTTTDMQTSLRAARFYPKAGYTGNVAVTFRIEWGNPAEAGYQTNLALTLTPTTGGFPVEILTFTANTVYTPTSWIQTYYGTADLLLVGSGGGGGYSSGGGGGGGRVGEFFGQTLDLNRNYAITIVPGGTAGTFSGPRNGGTPLFNFITAPAVGNIPQYQRAVIGGDGGTDGASGGNIAGGGSGYLTQTGNGNITVTNYSGAIDTTPSSDFRTIPGASASANGVLGSTISLSGRTSLITGDVVSPGGNGGHGNIQPQSNLVGAGGNRGTAGRKGMIKIKWRAK